MKLVILRTDVLGSHYRWQRLSDYTAQLSASSYQRVHWPNSEQEVYVHVVTTRVRKLYQCQVIIVRQSLDAPLAQTRYWASSDLEADLPNLLVHIATRWKIEVLFGDGKEELGLDHYQLMSADTCTSSLPLSLFSALRMPSGLRECLDNGIGVCLF